jgi:hypothetical protein
VWKEFVLYRTAAHSCKYGLWNMSSVFIEGRKLLEHCTWAPITVCTCGPALLHVLGYSGHAMCSANA